MVGSGIGLFMLRKQIGSGGCNRMKRCVETLCIGSAYRLEHGACRVCTLLLVAKYSERGETPVSFQIAFCLVMQDTETRDDVKFSDRRLPKKKGGRVPRGGLRGWHERLAGTLGRNKRKPKKRKEPGQ
jgi:hypothetical protein